MIALASTPALAGALGRDLLPEVERSRGLVVTDVYLTTTSLREQIVAGAVPDVLIGLDPALRELAAVGLLGATTRRPVATCGVGIAVAAHVDAKAPDTVEELVSLLTRASSVAYSRFGASGLHVARLLSELGIAEQFVPQATILERGFAAQPLADGRAEVALQLAPELLMVEGTKVLGMLPGAAQQEFAISLVLPQGGHLGAAEVADLLLTSVADDTYRRWGLVPVGHRSVDVGVGPMPGR